MSNNCELDGRITRLNIGDDYSCEFRLNGGQVICHCPPALALPIIERRGYPGHEVRVAGTIRAGRKKILDVTEVTLLT